MSQTSHTVVGLGELLWDLLPGGKQLGGAPANFAYHAALLGDRGIVASRVGSDDLGREALDRLKALALATENVQIDTRRPTGTVKVDLDAAGQPNYTIVTDVAWDFITWTPEFAQLAASADAVCFGSLAQRAGASRQTIRAFLRATRSEALRVFDINLRQSFYSREILTETLRLSTVVKLNDEELPEVLRVLDIAGESGESGAMRLLEDYDLQLVCVTRGENGSLLVSESQVVDHPGLEVSVADTVGAGDAFTAALAHHYLRRAPLAKISEAANRLGAWVASQTGATPEADPSIIRQVSR